MGNDYELCHYMLKIALTNIINKLLCIKNLYNFKWRQMLYLPLNNLTKFCLINIIL